MNARSQRICIWAAPGGFVLLSAALVVASWVPFPSPNRSAPSVAHFYAIHTDGIRVGALLLAAGAALLAPLAAVLAVQIKRIEGAFSPLAYLELGMGCASSLAITIPTFFWETAAFRPERDPVVTQSWHDAGWLCFTATIFIFMLQAGAIALAILSDRSAQPLFPRWLGYFTAWVALLLLPSALCLFFKTGPFAWSGIFTLYLAFAVIGAWFIALITILLRVVREQEVALAPV